MSGGRMSLDLARKIWRAHCAGEFNYAREVEFLEDVDGRALALKVGAAVGLTVTPRTLGYTLAELDPSLADVIDDE